MKLLPDSMKLYACEDALQMKLIAVIVFHKKIQYDKRNSIAKKESVFILVV